MTAHLLLQEHLGVLSAAELSPEEEDSLSQPPHCRPAREDRPRLHLRATRLLPASKGPGKVPPLLSCLLQGVHDNHRRAECFLNTGVKGSERQAGRSDKGLNA